MGELTDPARLEEWFATEVELDLEEGEGHFRWENGERHAVVETVEEGRRLVTPDRRGGRETQVDFTIEEVEEGNVTETAPVAEWGTALELRACAYGSLTPGRSSPPSPTRRDERWWRRSPRRETATATELSGLRAPCHAPGGVEAPERARGPRGRGRATRTRDALPADA